MIKCAVEAFGDVVKIFDHVARWLGVEHRGEKDAFADPPLGDAYGLAIAQEDLAGTTAREAHHPIFRLAIEGALIDRHRFVCEMNKFIGPPVTRAN